MHDFIQNKIITKFCNAAITNSQLKNSDTTFSNAFYHN